MLSLFLGGYSVFKSRVVVIILLFFFERFSFDKQHMTKPQSPHAA